MISNNLAKERIGLIGKNNYGSLMEVVEYKNSQNIMIKFIDYDFLVHAQWADFLIGNIRNPYDKTTFGIGYIGEGKYLASRNNKGTPEYNTWKSMMSRCYNKNFKQRNTAYKYCSVAEEWHNFQNFSSWYDENYYIIENEKMNLDKDILVKGNKIYSPDNCIFVPSRINSLFAKRNASRGKYPIGVSLKNEKYTANCDGKNLGIFNTPDEAFLAYKTNKEKLIKQISEEYKSKIPENLYLALQNYSVEIKD